MLDKLDGFCALDDLRTFVHRTLCQRENILPDQFSLTESPMLRQGQSCGLEFCLHGPRSIRLGAIWVEDHNVIYFYDAGGQRFRKVQLLQRVSHAVAL